MIIILYDTMRCQILIIIVYKSHVSTQTTFKTTNQLMMEIYVWMFGTQTKMFCAIWYTKGMSQRWQVILLRTILLISCSIYRKKIVLFFNESTIIRRITAHALHDTLIWFLCLTSPILAENNNVLNRVRPSSLLRFVHKNHCFVLILVWSWKLNFF